MFPERPKLLLHFSIYGLFVFVVLFCESSFGEFGRGGAHTHHTPASTQSLSFPTSIQMTALTPEEPQVPAVDTTTTTTTTTAPAPSTDIAEISDAAPAPAADAASAPTPAADEAPAAAAAPEAPEGVMLAGVTYVDEPALVRAVQAVQQRHAESEGEAERLAGADLLLLFSILERHPSRREKMGAGVVGVAYARNTQFGDGQEGGRCFYTLHPDGTRTSWAWRKPVERIFEGVKLEMAALGRKRGWGADESVKVTVAVKEPSDDNKFSRDDIKVLKEQLMDAGVPQVCFLLCCIFPPPPPSSRQTPTHTCTHTFTVEGIRQCLGRRRSLRFGGHPVPREGV